MLPRPCNAPVAHGWIAYEVLVEAELLEDCAKQALPPMRRRDLSISLMSWVFLALHSTTHCGAFQNSVDDKFKRCLNFGFFDFFPDRLLLNCNFSPELSDNCVLTVLSAIDLVIHPTLLFGAVTRFPCSEAWQVPSGRSLLPPLAVPAAV